jgi:hypothetical protein
VLRDLGAILLTSITCLLPAAAAAATHTRTQDPLQEAQRLRAAGDFASAARILTIRVAQNPSDGEAARLLAQTLYWLKDIEGARAAYENAMHRHPEDTSLRLQFARMLVETRSSSRARELLSALVAVPAVQADADTLLGTLAYWEGDLTSASQFFVAALRTNPAQEDAKRQLNEIRAITAPWIRVSSDARHDDQPLNRTSVRVEGGWFATPLTRISVAIQPMRYSLAPTTTRTLATGEARVSHYAPAWRLETEAGAGGIRRDTTQPAFDWTARVAAGLRLAHHVTLRGRVERTPYLYTSSSLDIPVMMQAVAAVVHLEDPRGWLGEGAYQWQRYPDDNAARSTYAWLMAPIVNRRVARLQAGYAVAAENADSSRFALAHSTQPFPPGDPRFRLDGRYVPYYTADHLVSHSLIAALTAGSNRSPVVRVGGSYGVRATDRAPGFVVAAGRILSTTAARRFTPVNAHGALEVPFRSRLVLEATGEIGRTVFYTWRTVGVGLTYRFPVSPDRAPGR